MRSWWCYYWEDYVRRLLGEYESYYYFIDGDRVCIRWIIYTKIYDKVNITLSII